MQPFKGSIREAEVRRVEDPRFLKGVGNYLDDMKVDEALWAVMVRSTIPHGLITSIDTEDAAAQPAVVGVFTAADLEGARMPAVVRSAPEETRRPLLAIDRVRHVGEPVAVVVARTRRQAVDAAEMVWVDYEPLPSVTTPEEALAADAPRLYPEIGSNLVVEGGNNAEADALAEAEVVVEEEFENQRVAPVPMETNNALAVPRPDGGVDVWLGTQSARLARNSLSRALNIDRDLLHVHSPDIGGGFGAKINVYREQALTVALALKLARPVRWQETRGEGMVGMSHGRGQIQRMAIGAKRDGTVLGLRWDVLQDAGAYPLEGCTMGDLTQRMAAGPYRIPVVDFRWQGIVTNTTPTDAYRGAGRPEAAFAIERILDLLAAELNMDPADIRRRNFVAPDAFPHVSATGERYDTGNYQAALELALTKAGYHQLRGEQARRRARNDRFQIGIGLASYVEVTAPGGRRDWSRAEITPNEVVVYSGALSQGQGHETTFAKIAAQRLGVPLERIRFVQGDTDHVGGGGGTMGSRSMQMAGSAVMRAADAVWEKARRIVAHHEEAALADVVRFENGGIGVAGVPDRAMRLFDVAVLAQDEGNLPPDEEPGLFAEDRWEQAEATVPFGTHVSVVEVDVETGEVRVLGHVACDDCGTIFDRMIVDGQVHGGVAQGIGQALWESFRYDPEGNPLTSNLTTYLPPTASSIPLIDIAHTETPTDQNPLGAKGIGESATIGSTPAVSNAVHDALRPYGVTHVDMPLTPARIWQALQPG